MKFLKVMDLETGYVLIINIMDVKLNLSPIKLKKDFNLQKDSEVLVVC
jgi:hypothetical protein